MVTKTNPSLYYKNAEIANRYKVSLTSIGRYITDSINAKNGLELILTHLGPKIKRQEGNILILDELCGNKSNFKNKTKYHDIYPKSSFYSSYSQEQIASIIRDLECTRSIKHKFLYFKEGADLFLKTWREEKSRAQEYVEMQLCFKTQADYLISYAKSHECVYNIINLRPSKMESSKDLITNLAKNSVLNEHIALDYSPYLLKFTKEALQDLILDYPAVKFNFVCDDYNYTNYYKLICDHRFTVDNKGKKIINIILISGRAIVTFEDYKVFLAELSEQLENEDYILFDKPISEYREVVDLLVTPNVPFYKFISYTFKSLGFEDHQFEIRVRHKADNPNQLIIYAKMLVNIYLNFNKEGARIRFDKDLEVELTPPWLVTMGEIREFCQQNSFKEVNILTSPSLTMMSLLLQKKSNIKTMPLELKG
jgi:Histidine-specific methyltransferase, SAM-dependent